jgi:hypothetical protein
LEGLIRQAYDCSSHHYPFGSLEVIKVLADIKNLKSSFKLLKKFRIIVRNNGQSNQYSQED